jgi:pyruvate/2-oxoglutarate dehydrogenase complex dihydrolipoamide acyltransferase (E2) component
MAGMFTAIGASLLGGGGAAVAGAAAGGLSGLSTILTVGSAIGSIMQGVSQANAIKAQAMSQAQQQMDMALGYESEAAQVAAQSAQEKARDAQTRAGMAEEYADLIAEQQAVQVANGLAPGVGSAADIQKATTMIAERNLNVSRENTANQAAIRRMQQRSMMSKASMSRSNASGILSSAKESAQAARLGGFIGGFTTMLSGFQRVG